MKKFKKLATLTLSLMMAFGISSALTACGGDKKDDTPDTQTSIPETITEVGAQTFAIDGEGVAEGKIKYQFIVQNLAGERFEGVRVMVCYAGGTCLSPVSTDKNGEAVVLADAESLYEVHIDTLPDGYTTDYTEHFDYSVTSYELAPTHSLVVFTLEAENK